ncbi:MAG TPA: hypothetical protein VE673_11180 [Pseudonocardiaceae bacterium]|nr:hypothetical protein [Pseudonocardiaceae bacterium]
MPDSPELAAAKRLLDAAKDRGFTFERIALGQDAPLRGIRESTNWLDEVYVGGLSSGCCAARRRRYSLIVPGGLPVTERISGNALEVLHTVVFDWDPKPATGRRLSAPRFRLPAAPRR